MHMEFACLAQTKAVLANDLIDDVWAGSQRIGAGSTEILEAQVAAGSEGCAKIYCGPIEEAFLPDPGCCSTSYRTAEQLPSVAAMPDGGSVACIRT